MTEPQKPISIRERLAIWLLLYAIRIVHPYEYEHEFKEIENSLRSIIKNDSK